MRSSLKLLSVSFTHFQPSSGAKGTKTKYFPVATRSSKQNFYNLFDANSVRFKSTHVTSNELEAIATRNPYDVKHFEAQLRLVHSTHAEYYKIIKFGGENYNIGKYIDELRFNSLTDIDRKSLNYYLFTSGGFYALEKKYITVDQFLSLPLHAKYALGGQFRDADMDRRDREGVEREIDILFGERYLDLNKLSKLTEKQSYALVQFLVLIASDKSNGKLTEDEIEKIHAKVSGIDNYCGNNYTAKKI